VTPAPLARTSLGRVGVAVAREYIYDERGATSAREPPLWGGFCSRSAARTPSREHRRLPERL